MKKRFISTPLWFQMPAQEFPTVRSVVGQQFATIAQAEKYAQGLKVTAVYNQNLVIADCANTLLTQIQARNLAMPMSVLVEGRFFAHLGESIRSAVAMAEHGTLFINPDADFWNDPISYTRAAYEARIWSTPHPLHPLYHEVGHLLQADRGPRGKSLTPREQTEARAISDRATEGVDEFVAEVFAGLFVGVKYDPEIMRAYTRYGGRKP